MSNNRGDRHESLEKNSRNPKREAHRTRIVVELGENVSRVDQNEGEETGDQKSVHNEHLSGQTTLIVVGLAHLHLIEVVVRRHVDVRDAFAARSAEPCLESAVSRRFQIADLVGIDKTHECARHENGEYRGHDEIGERTRQYWAEAVEAEKRRMRCSKTEFEKHREAERDY